MKLMIAVIRHKDVYNLMVALVRSGISATKLVSTGGFLREGNSTILIGVDDDDIESVLDIVKSTCSAREQLVTPITPVGPAESYVPYPVGVVVGGATVFILPIERFVKV